MWEEARVPGENPRAKADNRYTISHSNTFDLGDQTRVAAVISE